MIVMYIIHHSIFVYVAHVCIKALEFLSKIVTQIIPYSCKSLLNPINIYEHIRIYIYEYICINKYI
jgi:hypothetical protein